MFITHISVIIVTTFEIIDRHHLHVYNMCKMNIARINCQAIFLGNKKHSKHLNFILEKLSKQSKCRIYTHFMPI